MDKKNYFKQGQLKLLILFVILVNFSGVLHPMVRNDDPVLYANIVKHMVLSKDWLDLMFNQVDWLDKPHFPFWLTAVSFKVFGINHFSYILPGFIFHLLGAYFTYKLASSLYESADVGLIAAVLYLTSLHLLMSSIDVRAEAYLLGEVMGACYYWYKYHEMEGISYKYLILGSLFTALALMTKGVFVLITIGGGLFFIWAHTGQLMNLLRLKWILALILSLLLIFPEIYALYYQFDLHPEKLIFGQHAISGIKWFFWDSQFGRFFNSGPIGVNHVQPWHYLFFVHTFLWSFLPWSILFIYVTYLAIKTLCYKDSSLAKQKVQIWYLVGSFLPTFILFSCTKFQLDHYINILIPFAAILCAAWIYKRRVEYKEITHPILHVQVWLSYLLTFLVVILSVLIFGSKWLTLIVAVAILMLVLFIFFTHRDDLTKSFLYPTLAISLTFIFMMQINEINAQYDLGYQSAKYLNNLTRYPVVDYKVDSLTLEFYAKDSYQRIDSISQLEQMPKPYYLVVKTKDLTLLQLNSAVPLIHVLATTVDKVMSNLLTRPRLKDNLVDYSVVLVN